MLGEFECGLNQKVKSMCSCGGADNKDVQQILSEFNWDGKIFLFTYIVCIFFYFHTFFSVFLMKGEVRVYLY